MKLSKKSKMLIAERRRALKPLHKAFGKASSADDKAHAKVHKAQLEFEKAYAALRQARNAFVNARDEWNKAIAKQLTSEGVSMLDALNFVRELDNPPAAKPPTNNTPTAE